MNFFYITALILQKSIWVQVRFIFCFFLNLEVKGLENLDELKTNAIFIANHGSELDPIIIPASLPFFSRFSPLYFATLAKSEYFNSGWRQNFYGGILFKLFGGHPIYLGLKDYEKSLINHTHLLKNGKNICIFPEGKITPDGTVQPAHGGAAYLAQVTGKPVIPVAISGVYNMSNSDFFSRKRKVIVRFGKPVYLQFINNEYKEKAEKVMFKIKEML